MSDDLRREGVARELVNRIQNIRKESKFEVTDKIKVTIQKTDEIEEALLDYTDYICNQTLALNIEVKENISGALSIEWDETTLDIKVEKVSL